MRGILVMKCRKLVQKLFSGLLILALLVTVAPISAVVVNAEVSEFAGGSGTEEDPYLIETKYHLNNVRNYLNAHYKMIADIEFSATDFIEGGDFYNGGQGWLPIGTGASHSFTGSFDGNNKTIKGLHINIITSELAYVGLFGSCNGGDITSLIMDNGSIEVIGATKVYAGGICAYSANTNFYNCCNYNNMKIIVHAQSTGIEPYSYVGGVSGYGGNCMNCENKGNIITEVKVYNDDYDFIYCGGIVGGYAGAISNCSNYGDISATSISTWTVACVDVGGIAGSSSKMISNCKNYGNIFCNANNITSVYGGCICGSFSGGVLEKSYNAGAITAPYAGGIIGGLYHSTISNCYNLGNIISSDYAGGIAGYVAYSGEINSCYNIGVMSGTESYARIGGITGYMSSGISVGCYFGDNVSCGTGRGSATTNMKTIAEMQEHTTFADFDFEDIWEFTEGNLYKYPTLRNNSHYVLSDGDFQGGDGTKENPYLIATQKQLDNVRNCSDLHFKLVRDIVFNPDKDFQENGDFYNDGDGWMPILEFTGFFDGNGHFIENLYAYSADESIPVGLFGINKGQITSLGMISGSITSILHYAGGIVGINYGYIGKCYNRSYVASMDRAGGITGLNGDMTHREALIEECYNSGNIVSLDNSSYCGGIAGENMGGSITNCFNIGSITELYYSGGVLGYNYAGTLCNCYNIGDVTNNSSGNVSKKVLGNYNVFGGFDFDNNYRLGDEHFDYGDAKQRTTYELRNEQTFLDWDFASVWTMGGNVCYPYPELMNVKMVSDHVFDNSCDNSCDCGYTRTISHNYNPAFDSENHFEKCTVCDDIININVHEFDNSCDTTCDCGYTREITHNYQTSFDELEHFDKCTVCSNIINRLHHEFDNSCDKTCDCGYIRAVDHEYIPSYDLTYHFDKCSFCGDTINIETHKFDSDCDESCDCGYIRTDVHNYRPMYDELSHFDKCTICGDIKNVQSHSYEDDLGETCACGYVNHDYRWVIDKPNDCGTNGQKHEKCRICDTTRNENTIILATGNHTYTNSCDTTCNICQEEREVESHKYYALHLADESNHWLECAICHHKDDVGEHSYSNDCDTSCNICQKVRDVGHNFNNGICTRCGEADPNYEEPEMVTMGDLDGDGNINAKDALVVLKISVGKTTPTEQQKATADVNKDGQTNAKDALEILKHSVGKPSALDKKD